MKYSHVRHFVAALVIAGSALSVPLNALEPQNSARMERAKDFIADEQWLRAIEVLKAAARDHAERNKDEALFWLAHSQHQARDLGGAVETIGELERKFPASRWVKPARSLRVELAQKLRRDDVLWWTATAPTPTPTLTPGAVGPATPPGFPAAPLPPSLETPRPATAAAPPAPPLAAGGRHPRPRPAARSPRAPTPPPTAWMSEHSVPDTDLRIQALGSLIQTDAPRVIPMLREIALASDNPNQASRAVFVLAQSGRPEAHSTVLEVARRGAEPVSIAAVRELGRFGGARVSEELMQVYGGARPRVKYQVVSALGERAATSALMRIAQSESDQGLRYAAIVTLGQAGGRQQLHGLYSRARTDLKHPIIQGLFNARAEDELIAIARKETDAGFRAELLRALQLLGTPKAKQYLEKQKVSR